MNLTGKYPYIIATGRFGHVVNSIFVLIFILASVSCYAQSGILKGKITDAKTKEEIPGASIVLIGTYKGSVSNVNGDYEIKDIKPEDYSVKIRCLGYADKIINGVRISVGVKLLNILLTETSSELNTVEIIGDNNLINLESAKSETKVGKEDIIEMNTRDVQELVANMNGVSENPDGLQLRGGRVYETEYVIDGVSAKDPLAGTGFGVNVSSNAINDVTVTTGGVGAEYGYAASGVIATNIKEGGDKFFITGGWQRDNLGQTHSPTAWNTDIINLALGTPIPGTKNKLTFFTSASGIASDDYYGIYTQLHSSLFTNSTFWAPREDNSWSQTLKLAWNIGAGQKLSLTNAHSLSISQNTRVLQITGENQLVTPGLQYAFSLEPQDATTYTNQDNLTVLNYICNVNTRWHMEASAARLFTNSRADANGRPFRDPSANQVYTPASIVKNPVTLFNAKDSFVYVNPGPGLYNNGGISTVWHDHFVNNYSIKLKFDYIPNSKYHYFTFGFDHTQEEYQWVDVTSPWIGAPVRVNDSVVTPSNRVGATNDIWHVKPEQGGFYAQDLITYKGILATLAVRYNYWAAGSYIDDAIINPNTPILPVIRKSYLDHTANIFGLRYKSRILPKIRVSFPVTENNVLYFNYGYSMQMPAPQFVYAGLNPVYQDQSYLSNLGNPDLNPEVTVSYELGLKSQINKDFAISLVAFENDKFDYIVAATTEVPDQTGALVEKTFYINQDYALIRGAELSLSRRIGKSLTAVFDGSYQIATGKSSSALESALQIRQNGFVSTSKMQYLAWDRPYDFKGSLIYILDSNKVGLKYRIFRDIHFFIDAHFQAGIRYTPYKATGVDAYGRVIYDEIQSQPYADIGTPWFWTDLKVSKNIRVGKQNYLSFGIEIRNLFNNKNAQVIDPVTGRAYQYGDPVPYNQIDPRYFNPNSTGLPPTDPSRYLPPRQVLYAITFKF